MPASMESKAGKKGFQRRSGLCVGVAMSRITIELAI
jgi:hypothetical protein